MKKSIFITLITAVLLVTLNACNNSTPKNTAIEANASEKTLYTCSMHPEVQSDKPGDCPVCGMPLIIQEHADSTHMHNQSDSMHKMQ